MFLEKTLQAEELIEKQSRTQPKRCVSISPLCPKRPVKSFFSLGKFNNSGTCDSWQRRYATFEVAEF